MAEDYNIGYKCFQDDTNNETVTSQRQEFRQGYKKMSFCNIARAFGLCSSFFWIPYTHGGQVHNEEKELTNGVELSDENIGCG